MQIAYYTYRAYQTPFYKNRQINDNLEQQAQALFNEMFPHITEGENMIGNLIMPKRGKDSFPRMQ